MTFQDFIKYLYNSVIPQSICLSTHVICAMALILYIKANRFQTPIIQNSPILTIIAQVVLVIASLCLFLSKLFVIHDESHTYNKDDSASLNNITSQLQKKCFGYFDYQSQQIIIALNVVYTFCIQFMYLSYFLKMVRVLLICFQNKIVSKMFCIFGKEYLLILISFLWGLLISGGDVLMKLYLADGNNSGQIHMYPQFNQFMCDSNIQTGHQSLVQGIFIGKLVFYFMLFFISFIFSFYLQQIDGSLKLRFQYFAILLLPYSIWITDKIIKICDSNRNTALPVHYVDCFSNLLTGVFIFIIHFNKAKDRDFFLTQAYELTGDYDLTSPMSNDQLRQTWRSYFEHRNKKLLFETKCKILKPDYYNHQGPTKQNIQQICSCLQQRDITQILSNTLQQKQFNKAKQIIDKKVKEIIQEWKYTVSGQAMLDKLQRNEKYITKMKQLKLLRNYSGN